MVLSLQLKHARPGLVDRSSCFKVFLTPGDSRTPHLGIAFDNV